MEGCWRRFAGGVFPPGRGPGPANLPPATFVLTAAEQSQGGAVPQGPGDRASSSRLATEVERLHAGFEPLRRKELETPRTGQAMKQRRPATTDDGMNDEAVLVDVAARSAGAGGTARAGLGDGLARYLAADAAVAGADAGSPSAAGVACATAGASSRA